MVQTISVGGLTFLCKNNSAFAPPVSSVLENYFVTVYTH